MLKQIAFRRQVLTLFVLAMAWSDFAGAGEIAWPTKPIQLIVPASAGGGTDVSARIAAKYLSEALGQPIMISNVRGAGGSIGTKQAKDSPPDGYTMFYIHEDIVTNEVLGVSNFGYRDFDIVAKIFDVDLVTVIAGKEFKNLDAVKKAAKDKPGEVTFAIDIATSAHLVPLLMEEQMGIELNMVDSGSMNDRVPLLISGQLGMTFGPLGIVKDYVANGDINCLGSLSEKRSHLMPNLPTFREQGVDVVVKKYFIFYFPKGTSREIIAKCSDALERISKNAEFVKSAENLLYEVKFARAPETVKYLEESERVMNRYKKLILEAKK